MRHPHELGFVVVGSDFAEGVGGVGADAGVQSLGTHTGLVSQVNPSLHLPSLHGPSATAEYEAPRDESEVQRRAHIGYAVQVSPLAQVASVLQFAGAQPWNTWFVIPRVPGGQFDGAGGTASASARVTGSNVKVRIAMTAASL